ncbi:tyrosine-type recombinase/integrase [Methanococcus maripaludis]|uniref:Integrase/recombinase XerD n=1 Tax=Methanococcus maripaludis TaxID=39152 RepID=A0A7J9S1P6_METMI|nr:tyrosine-type recombinase/integrase [Methanococcus maripaludis]MBB6068173.1 integrase/recombinase XerD [Methanococcus maripaludis]
MQDLKNKLVFKPNRENPEESEKMNRWLVKFKEEREFDGIMKNTMTTDVVRLKIFLDFVEKRLEKEPDNMRNSDFIQFFNYLNTERKLSKSTQNRYFNLLKVFYRTMRLSNFLDFSDESIERKRFSRSEVKHYDAISEAELNEVIQSIVDGKSKTQIRDALVIRLLWDTGCRLSEVINLKYEDCDFKEGIFKLKNTKGKVERTVTCSKDTLDVLNQYKQYNPNSKPENYIFQTIEGKIIRKNWISKVFREHVKKLKEKGIIARNRRLVTHSLRHGRAVDFLDKGVPIDIVKEYLGHASLETTLFYSHSRERKDKMLKDLKKLL